MNYKKNLKKFLIILIAVCAAFSALSLSGCFNGRSDEHTHKYEAVSERAATCTDDGFIKYRCSVCYDTYIKTLPALKHDYKEKNISAATCLAEGKITYECSRCGKVKTETAYADHAAAEDATWIYEEAEDGVHYKLCKWCGTKVDEEKHKFTVTTLVEGNCLTDGEYEYACVCGYSFTKITLGEHDYEVDKTVEPTCETGRLEYKHCLRCGDTCVVETAPKLDHHVYEAHICVYCERDMLSDYFEEFTERGNSDKSLINVESEDELICLMDYVLAYEVISDQSKNKGKQFRLTYDYDGTSSVYFNEVLTKKTAYSYALVINTYSPVIGSDWFGIGIPSNDVLNEKTANSITCNDGVYEQEFLAEVDSALYTAGADKRSSDFTDFKYKNRKYEMNVSSSNSLYYALSHGYKPVAKEGSDAEKVLIAAENVLKKIVNDDMSDVNKLWEIYKWTGKNVRYDYGAVTYTNGKPAGTNYTLQAWFAESVFFNGSGICDSISKAFGILAGIEDIVCVQTVGNSHAWNKVLVDADKDGAKEWYVIDPTYANLKTGSGDKANELFTAAYFMITDEEKSKTDPSTNCKDAVAGTDFNIYKNINYKSGGDGLTDLYASNLAEARGILDHYKSKYLTIKTPVLLEFACDKSVNLTKVGERISFCFGAVSYVKLEYKSAYVILIILNV